MKNIFVACLLMFSVTHASEAVKGAKKDVENFKIEMQSQMNVIEANIKNLRSRIKDNGKAAQKETLAELEKSKEKLNSQIESIKDEGDSKWKNMKKELSESLESLNARIQKALKD